MHPLPDLDGDARHQPVLELERAGGGKLRPIRSFLLRKRLEEPVAPAAQGGLLAAPATLLRQLVEGGRILEALTLMAYALPEREAVWWAVMCVRNALQLVARQARQVAQEQVVQEQALTAAELWVRVPDEERARRCLDAARAAGYASPAAYAARAAARARLPDPRSLAAGREVERAVRRALGGEAPRVSREAWLFLASGCDIARGGAGRTQGLRP